MTAERPTPSTSKSIRASVLADLVSAHPRGVATADLLQNHGVAVKSRIQELVAEGYQVEAVDLDGGVPGYRLVTLERGRGTRILAGCILRLTDDPAEPWSARTHGEARTAKVIPAEALEEAQRDAEAAYRARLVARGYGNLLGADSDHQDELEHGLPEDWDPLDEEEG